MLMHECSCMDCTCVGTPSFFTAHTDIEHIESSEWGQVVTLAASAEVQAISIRYKDLLALKGTQPSMLVHFYQWLLFATSEQRTMRFSDPAMADRTPRRRWMASQQGGWVA